MSEKKRIGGVIHAYQRYDPQQWPSPLSPPPDVASAAFEHMLAYGDLRELTEEELARAVELDPRQIAGLGPSLESLLARLRARKQKILSTYETDSVQAEAARRYQQQAAAMHPPAPLAKAFARAAADEQLFELERLWYRVEDERGRFARDLLRLVSMLGDKYQVDALAAKYTFTGRTAMSVPEAIEIKNELEEIDRLIAQLEEAAKTAQLAIIDLSALSNYAESEEIDELKRLAEQARDLLRQWAEQQGLERARRGYQLTPKAYRLFQGRLLDRIFSGLQAARSGRHSGPIVGEGAVELPRTKPYEFGDSLAHIDLCGTLLNAMFREGPGLPVRLRSDDIEVHRTRNNPKCATCVLLDMSGSMRYDGLYVHVKRMALALDGLIRREFPGDYLQFVEVFTFAQLLPRGEVISVLPKPVTLGNPVVRLKVDMSDPRVNPFDVPAHFTNLQHGLRLARQLLAVQDTPNRQVVLITDGLPTAHFEERMLYLLYPPDRRTEEATMREGVLCRRDGITINIFLLQSWWQSHADVQFAYRLAETAQGRVFFTAGKDLDRYVVWDYLARRREIIAG